MFSPPRRDSLAVSGQAYFAGESRSAGYGGKKQVPMGNFRYQLSSVLVPILGKPRSCAKIGDPKANLVWDRCQEAKLEPSGYAILELSGAGDGQCRCKPYHTGLIRGDVDSALCEDGQFEIAFEQAVLMNLADPMREPGEMSA
jgi:hypothetical protein